jgi:hypothetical protein
MGHFGLSMEHAMHRDQPAASLSADSRPASGLAGTAAPVCRTHLRAASQMATLGTPSLAECRTGCTLKLAASSSPWSCPRTSGRRGTPCSRCAIIIVECVAYCRKTRSRCSDCSQPLRKDCFYADAAAENGGLCSAWSANSARLQSSRTHCCNVSHNALHATWNCDTWFVAS